MHNWFDYGGIFTSMMNTRPKRLEEVLERLQFCTVNICVMINLCINLRGGGAAFTHSRVNAFQMSALNSSFNNVFFTDDYLTRSLVVINVDPFQLERWIANIVASWVNAMFIGNHFPKLQKNSFDNTRKSEFWVLVVLNELWMTKVKMAYSLKDERFFRLEQGFAEKLKLLTFEPIWLPHWPAWRCTISLIFEN